MEELTSKQIEQQDAVDNALIALLQELSPKPIEYPDDFDGEILGKLRDVVQEILVDDLKVTTAMEFYPYIDEEEDGKPKYTVDGCCVLKDGGVMYDEPSEEEAEDICYWANRFIQVEGRDHADWEELFEWRTGQPPRNKTNPTEE